MVRFFSGAAEVCGHEGASWTDWGWPTNFLYLGLCQLRSEDCPGRLTRCASLQHSGGQQQQQSSGQVQESSRSEAGVVGGRAARELVVGGNRVGAAGTASLARPRHTTRFWQF